MLEFSAKKKKLMEELIGSGGIWGGKYTVDISGLFEEG